jgi:hypothetical protein
MLTLVAPLVPQLSVLLPPAVMLAGFAVNELMIGRVVPLRLGLVKPTQPVRPTAAKSNNRKTLVW